jgi:Domain of unknown function (DUF4177)
MTNPARITRYEYKVVEVREKMFGGKMSGHHLERLLNEHAGCTQPPSVCEVHHLIPWANGGPTSLGKPQHG